MKTHPVVLVLTVIVCPLVLAAANDARFKSLFNGIDLGGWKWREELKGRWEVADGVIRLRPDQPKNRERGVSYDLWTEESFRAFVLEVDWRLTAKPLEKMMNDFTADGLFKDDGAAKHKVMHAGDSGIYLRGSSRGQVNIWSQPMGSGDLNYVHKRAAFPVEIRKAAMPRLNADRPAGQWNTFVITLKGMRVSVVLNGQNVIDNALLPDVAPEGPIGLQNHGDPIEFRNIRVKKLR